jgi:HD-GYP domain-containing protein (c-di-GMP phosphodiesterase class II)
MIAVLAAAGSDDPKDKEEAIEKCQNFAEDIIQVAMSENETEDIYKQIQLIHEEIGLEHSTATATFAVIFSLGIGYTDQQDLSQIALSGLLHDIGFVKIDHELLTIPENAMNADQKRKFQEHVDHSIHILDDVDLNLPEEIIDIIYQHHERFDGSGYPNGASGFEINDLSQLISVADHLDDIMAGRFDGVEKSPAQALDLLKKMQNKNNVPSLFNPDIFSRIRHLIENGENLAEQQKKAQERTQESLRQTG